MGNAFRVHKANSCYQLCDDEACRLWPKEP